MVLIRTPDSKVFEEAHFVLRAEVEARSSGEDDMLTEANRIIEEAGLGIAHSKRRRRIGIDVKGFVGFLLGGLFGGGVVGAVWLLLVLL